jgi:hypothetical protein
MLPKITPDILARFNDELIIDDHSVAPRWSGAAQDLMDMAGLNLSPAQRRELIQCVRIGIYRAQKDVEEQKDLSTRAIHEETVKRREELLRLLER